MSQWSEMMLSNSPPQHAVVALEWTPRCTQTTITSGSAARLLETPNGDTMTAEAIGDP